MRSITKSLNKFAVGPAKEDLFSLQVIFKMDAYGHGVAVDLADLSKLTKLKLHEFTQEKFRHMCILSGCDYLPSIKGIGLQTAIKLLRKSSSVHKVRC